MKRGDKVTYTATTPQHVKITLTGVVEISSATRAHVSFDESEYWPAHTAWIKHDDLAIIKEPSRETHAVAFKANPSAYYVIPAHELENPLSFENAMHVAQALAKETGLSYAIVGQSGYANTIEIKHG